MSNPDRPQAPGYLANLMGRLFHEVAGEGLEPLGIAPATFPLLVEIWFGNAAPSRQSLSVSQEMGAADVDALVAAMASAGLIEPAVDEAEEIRLTERGESVKGEAIAAARRANAAAAAVLSEEEMAAFIGMMNRVIDGLLAAKTPA